jgi:hypothetical protein
MPWYTRRIERTNSLDIDRREAAFPRRASRTGESVGSRRKKCYGETEYKIHLYRRNGISKGFVEVFEEGCTDFSLPTSSQTVQTAVFIRLTRISVGCGMLHSIAFLLFNLSFRYAAANES